MVVTGEVGTGEVVTGKVVTGRAARVGLAAGDWNREGGERHVNQTRNRPALQPSGRWGAAAGRVGFVGGLDDWPAG